MQPQPPHDADGRDPLPQNTTPTWEMELLISGATVFSLLQLPDLLDRGFYALLPRFEASASAIVTLPYTYLVAATYALISTFVLHLATRAYWVALVGLRSIHPGGIDWEKLRWGPAYKRVIEDRYPSFSAAVESADNRASSVFGFGIGFALTMLAPLLLMVVLSTFAYAIFELSGRSLSWGMVWTGVFVLTFAPFTIAVLLDRYVKGIRPDSTLGRATEGVLAKYLRGGFSAFTNYPITLFFSRFGQYRSSAVMTVAILAILAVVFVRMMAREDALKLDGYLDLPSFGDSRGHALDPRSYADQRTGLFSLRPRPYIQSEVIEGDYLRLFLPYDTTRDGIAMTRLCPKPVDADIAEGTEASAAWLDCAERMYTLSIDGNVLASVQFDLATEPELGLRGFVAMLDVSGLARGRHLLEINRVRTEPEDAAGDDDAAKRRPARPTAIVFWR